MVRGTVRSVDGHPLTGAVVDAWQADDAGFYDVQLREPPREQNLRGLFTADQGGEFWFRTVVPKFYPIPDDGPVGHLLHTTKRHPYRPAHIHFISAAEGFKSVVTHLFVAGCPYLEDDTVLGVKESLSHDVQRVDDPGMANDYGVTNPFELIEFDVVLEPTGSPDRVSPGARGD